MCRHLQTAYLFFVFISYYKQMTATSSSKKMTMFLSLVRTSSKCSLSFWSLRFSAVLSLYPSSSSPTLTVLACSKHLCFMSLADGEWGHPLGHRLLMPSILSPIPPLHCRLCIAYDPPTRRNCVPEPARGRPSKLKETGKRWVSKKNPKHSSFTFQDIKGKKSKVYGGRYSKDPYK